MVIQVLERFPVQLCLFLPHFLNLFCFFRSLPFLSFIVSILAWNVPLVSPVFLKSSLILPILLFSSVGLHSSLKKAFLSLLATLWNSTFSWVSVQSLSRVWLFVTSWTAACLSSLSITNSQSVLKLMSIKLVMPSNHLILCHPLLLLPSIFPSIRVFSNEIVLLIKWPKYWRFSFRISPSNEYSGLISFRMDWLDLLAVQGTLKSLLQHQLGLSFPFSFAFHFSSFLSHF